MDLGVMTRKPVADILKGSREGPSLAKSLGLLSIVALGIGDIIGAGIFVLTGTAAAQFAGPSVMLSFALGGIVCGLIGLCYAELSAMLPVSGSTYSYTYATLGELVAWIIGWDLVLEYATGTAAVAVGWSSYATSMLRHAGLTLPPTLSAATGTAVKLPDGSTVTGIANLPAVLVVAALTALLILGTSESAKLNNVIVAIKLAVVLAFIGVGAFYVDPAHWHPFIPANTGGFGHFGYSGLLRGSAVVFFAFLGFDAACTAAQEARNPQRDMPVGILGAVAVCTVLYVVVAAVLTGIVPYAQLNVADPVAKGVEGIGLPWFSALIELGALLGLTTVILVSLYGCSRVLLTVAHDGLLPPVFARVNPRTQTPIVSQLLIGAGVAVIAAVFPIGELSELVSIGTLLAFVLVCGAVIRLRQTDPAVERPFRMPWVPVIPIVGALCCVLLMAGLPLLAWLRLGVWMAIGLSIYAVYGRWYSVLRHPK